MGLSKKYKPDLVLSNYKLPRKKHDLQAASEIVSEPLIAKIVIIIAFESVREKTVRMNFSRSVQITVLIKPVKLSHLDELF